ncbi:MAG: LysM peptidoglycan-binding domain-containing protein [Ignavibacteriales bacterium]|nr:LysM peptidoglycan-binding domain-containing protein [Ignavibacteriales bacterium]
MMKIGMMLGLICSLLVSTLAIAQEEEKQEMTKDAWEKAMQEAKATRDQLKTEIDSLDKEIAQLKTRDAQLADDIRKGNEELATLLGESQKKDFEQRLDRIEAMLDDLAKLTGQDLSDREGDLNDVGTSIGDARAQRLAQLQEYRERLEKQQQRLDDMRGLIAELKAEKEEVVVGTWAEDRACLWNIAKKAAVYGDATLWAKLWQANTNTISNPDILKPGQRLKVPKKAPLTSQEIAALREYHNERAAEQPQYAESTDDK